MSDDRSALEHLFQTSTPGATHVLLHYLYFPTRHGASDTAKELRARGFETEERLGADGVNWLVLAKHEVIPSEETMAANRELTTAGKPKCGPAEQLEAGRVVYSYQTHQFNRRML